VGIGSDARITFSASEMSLRHALNHMLRQLDLTYTLLDDALLITTPEEAEASLQARVYPVADLNDLVPFGEGDFDDPFGGGVGGGIALFGLGGCAGFGSQGGGTCDDYDSLIELITTAVAPTSWDDAGGPGSAEAYDGLDLCVISQTPQIHEQIEALLKKLREKLAEQPESARPADDRQTDKLRLVVYLIPSPPAAKKDQENETTGNANLPPLEAEEVLDVIRELVEPDSWKREGVYARAVGGRLIIRQTEAVHREISQVLGRLGVFFYAPPSGPGGGGMGMGGMGGGFF
jgi:hypothetical protein